MTNVLNIFLEITVTASLMILVVMAIRAVLAKRMNPIVIAALWAVVLVRLCIPVTLESPVHLAELIPEQPVIEQASDVSVGTADVPTLQPVQDTWTMAEPFAPTEMQQPTAQITETTQSTFFETLGATIKIIPLWSVLTGVWILGALAVLLITLRQGCMFKRRLKKCKRITDGKILHIVNQHKQTLGVKRNITVLECNDIKTPAVFGYFRPHILLPTAFAQGMDMNGVRCILLHEICHIKRHDILKSYAWLFAKAVHWFNPLVWLAYKMDKDDVELCCDQMVLGQLSKESRYEYTQSLIDVFRMTKQKTAFPITVSLFENKTKLVERVMRMLKPQKKSRGAVAVSLILAVIMIVACFTTACFPIAKADDESNTAETGTEAPMVTDAPTAIEIQQEMSTRFEKLYAPEKYTTHITVADGKLIINADADVIMPQSDKIPTVKVKAVDFSQEIVDGLIEVLFDGETIYECIWGADTKAEIDQQIDDWEQRKKTEEYSSDGDQKKIDEYITMLKEKYKTAPEKSTDTINESDGQLKLMERIYEPTGEHIANYYGLIVTTNYEDYDKAATLRVQNNSDLEEKIVIDRGGFVPVRDNATVIYENTDGVYNYGQNPPILVDENTVIDGAVKEKLKTTPEQAEAIAAKMLEDVGVDDMVLSGMYLVDDEQLGNYDGIVSPAEHYAYRMYFCRKVGGLPCSDTGVLRILDNSSVSCYESIEMMVDDRGVISLKWQSPLEVTETVTEDTAVLPFDRITEIFEQCVQETYGPETQHDSNYLVNITFDIDHASLELRGVKDEGRSKKGGSFQCGVFTEYKQ